jgi:hypothetical protein
MFPMKTIHYEYSFINQKELATSLTARKHGKKKTHVYRSSPRKKSSVRGFIGNVERDEFPFASTAGETA